MQPSSSEIPKNCFLKDDHGRSFLDNWFWKKISPGELIRRKWMSYSQIKIDNIVTIVYNLEQIENVIGCVRGLKNGEMALLKS